DPVAGDVEQRLEQEIRALQQQLESTQQQLARMQAELQQLKAQKEAVAAQQQQAALPGAGAASAAAGISPDLSLWGYGEIYYDRPVHIPELAEADLARAVFGIGYRFDDRTLFNSEFEVEHAVSSASDRGEFEVEQFYVDHQLAAWAAVKGGLILMPFGLLNEHHEPTQFYGVKRNHVEKLIIPTTWREGGVGFHGDTPGGLVWDAGVTTGINLKDWNFTPAAPFYRTSLDLEAADIAPMQATHQELELADAQHLAQYAALNYSGVPGLLAGAAVFSGKAAVPAGFPDVRATLWEVHGRWTAGRADLSALYARGTFSDTAPFNLANLGASNPLPAEFLGYYLQGAYTVWEQGSYRLSPFIRWERYDMGAAYQGIAPGYTTVPPGPAPDGRPWPQPRDRVWTAGANFYLTPHVVLKADYQRFAINTDFSSIDLGLGVNF
ncbi:MAG TPA: hypothetical protein VM713_08265, partial [Steroidobacteraceae bacterium]|nr:hypothetical protein [Steroidobacteraceae bacterium]